MKKSFILPLAVAGSLLLPVILYQGFKSSFDIRSRAALETGIDVPLFKRTGGAGESCGLNSKILCKKDLVCAPLLLVFQSGSVNTEVQPIGDDTTPSYGACVKTGVWPQPSSSPTAGSKPCMIRPQPCVESPGQKCPEYAPPAPGTVICSPTPIPSQTEPLPNPPVGCKYQYVKCVQAPCQPTLSCTPPDAPASNY